MAEVALALYWHQHQPYYPDDVAGDNPMPWVRLHGVKDYYGMALHLLECPEMRCTINLVPSLLMQIQAYTERGASDRFLQISRQPANGLAESDCLFLLDHFFMANPEHMIRPNPRYAELHHRRAAGKNSSQEALRRFKEKDLRDLQVWFNLAWVHPLLFERDSELREMQAKGRSFTEEEKNRLLDKHLEILRAIIPMHRKLAERGQVELTTTPYYHPILPLLFDKRLSREAMPDIKLPRYPGGYLEDAAVQVRRAVDFHIQVFGKPPTGMWPAEGSVCQAMLPLLAEQGIRWIATDEEILGAATHGFVSRDSRGHVLNPNHMYRPYKASEAGRELGIVFRDHSLSDMIGFHYQRSEPDAAAEDFVSHLRGIGQAIDSPQPALVSVILDGENSWEHYPGGGVAFLRSLYERCIQTPEIHPVPIGEFLETHPPQDTLPHLFAGSWIHHNFAIWIGHEEDNTAWDALHQTREHLRRREAHGQKTSEILGRAWEEIYIAEGSDWFWWFGDENSCAQDALFDYLFRKHLQNVYTLLGDTPPESLKRPIKRRGQRPIHSMPRAFLDVKVDGRRTFFKWLHAGRYTCQSERSTMAMASWGPIKEVYFGFDTRALLIGVDFHGSARVKLAGYEAMRIRFEEPAEHDVVITGLTKPTPQAQLLKPGRPQAMPASDRPASVQVGIEMTVELAIPFEQIGVTVNQPIQFFVELIEAGQSRDRAPREGAISLTCPSPDFEQIMWDV
jgi:alpha-amylase/alpha-mannosidase (GH57 family)